MVAVSVVTMGTAAAVYLMAAISAAARPSAATDGGSSGCRKVDRRGIEWSAAAGETVDKVIIFNWLLHGSNK